VAATQTAELDSATPAGFAAVSRAVVAAAADLVTGVQRVVVGPENVRTARDNAWDAILADRARNEARAELTRAVAALLAAGPRPRVPSPTAIIGAGTPTAATARSWQLDGRYPRD
jgi:hypothetical protein